VTLDDAYEFVTTQWNDVQENIPALEQHVKEVGTEPNTKIIELGVRAAISTIVFLHALEPDDELWSVDIAWPTGPLLPALNQSNWVFTRGDDLDLAIVDTLPKTVDLVFIDTVHSYLHTMAELEMYERRVRDGGRILLHDTELEQPETAPHDEPYPVRRAAEEFAASCDLKFENDPTGYGLGCIYVS
jgi:predicted O-methyltransferase YrrM